MEDRYAYKRISTRSSPREEHALKDEHIRLQVAQGMLNTRVAHANYLSAKLVHNSVYSQMIVLPQVARSAGWPKEMISLVLKTFLCFALNNFIQVVLLVMIQKEERVMSRFYGQMHLCDFGAFVENCPDAPGCVGPGGTKYSAPRLHDWDKWVSRIFLRDSLLALFPERSHEIHDLVDPGEYGLEHYWSRLISVFVFMLVMMEEMLVLARAAYLLYKLPSESENWLRYEGTLPDDEAGAMPGIEPFLLKLKVAGMSRTWKILNVLLVLVPMGIILRLTIVSGIEFLMDTAEIDRVIVNCVALSFLLTIDEAIYHHLSDRATKAIMENIEDLELRAKPVLTKHETWKASWYLEKSYFLVSLLPLRLFALIFLTFLAVSNYYETNCTLRDGGNWIGGYISKPIFQPISLYIRDFAVLKALFFELEVDLSATSLWAMPET